MKIFIIILFILILIYIILKKKENFQVSKEQIEKVRKYYDENPSLRTEEINNRLGQDFEKLDVTKNMYMQMTDEMDLERLGTIFNGEKMNFLTDFNLGLGLPIRSGLFTSTLTPVNEEASYNFFNYNFKKIQVDTSSLGNDYDNPQKIDYVPLFLQKFKPNVVLKLNFKKPSDEVRIRYEILNKRGGKVITSGYVAYDKRGVFDFDFENIQLQYSPMNRMYEPYESILTTGKYLNIFNQKQENRVYSNHYLNLHKLIYDVKNSTGQKDFDDIREKYSNEDKYMFAFENINQTQKNLFKMYDGDYSDLILNGDGEINVVNLEIPEETENLKGKNIIFDTENCIQTQTEFYISPGKYKMNIILDKVESNDYEDGVLATMEYNMNDASESSYKVIKNMKNEPINLLELKNYNNINATDYSFFLKSNVTELINDMETFVNFIKLNNGSFKVDTEMNLIKPERYKPFIMLCIFRILLKFRIMKGEELGTFKNLLNMLDTFYSSYLNPSPDTRTIDDKGSPEYKRIETRYYDLIKRGDLLTVPEEQQIFALQQELHDLREEELERIHGPRPPDNRKISRLEKITDDVYDYTNLEDKKKKMLEEKNSLEQQQTHYSDLIESNKRYIIEKQVSSSSESFTGSIEHFSNIELDDVVDKNIILETYHHDIDEEKTRYVQMAPDGKDTIFGKTVYIKSKANDKYLSDVNGGPQLSDTPHPWIISKQLTRNKHAAKYHNSQRNFGGHSIRTKGDIHLVKNFDGVGYHLSKDKGWVKHDSPNHEKPGRFYLTYVGKNTYNIMNYFQTEVGWMEDWYKKNGGIGNKNDVNWGIKAVGNNIKADFKTVNNSAMEWEIIVVNPLKVSYQAYAFNNTITQKNVFKLLKNEDNTYSFEFKKGDKKMYLDYSKYYITLNENNTDNARFTIHKGKAGSNYFEFRQKKNPDKPYKSLFHYHGLGPRWNNYPYNVVTKEDTEPELYNFAGPEAKIPLDFLSRDGEIASDFSGEDPNNRASYYNHPIFGNWLSFKMHIVKPVEEFSGSIEHFSSDPLGDFREAASRIIKKEDEPEPGLLQMTELEKEQRRDADAQPEISLSSNDFLIVLNSGLSPEACEAALKERTRSQEIKIKELELLEMKDLLSLKTSTKKNKMSDIINSYVDMHLKNVNNEGGVEIYYNELLYKLNLDKVDEEGKTSKQNKSSESMNYKRSIYSGFDFKVEMKKDPIFSVEKQEKPIELIEEEVEEDEVEDVDTFTLIIRRILTEIKKDFRQIVKTKNYEYLSPILENLLLSVHTQSKNQVGEGKAKIKKVIEIILNLVDKVKDGSIDDINDLLDRKVSNYKFPEEILQENFSNYNTMNPNTIEHFESDYHKHRSDGVIDFDLQWGNPLLKENEGRYDEYSLLSDMNKNNLMKSYNKMENVLSKASNMVNNFAVGMESKMNNYDSSKVEKNTNQAVNNLENTLQDSTMANYEEKENEQKLKLNRITGKVEELEKLQNKAYVGNSKEFNTIKSFGDGQILSIKNMKNDIYNVLVNGECLSYNKRNNVEIQPCNSSKNQQFKVNSVTDMNMYNDVITRNEQEPVGEFDGISYPFSMVNPVLHQSQCLTLNGNSVGIKDCMNSNKQRWEGLKNMKLCDKL